MSKDKTVDLKVGLNELIHKFGKGQPWGGGSASALGGLVAVGLLEKVAGFARLSMQKRDEIDHQLEQAKTELLSLIWEDAEVFKKFMDDQKNPDCQHPICAVPLKISLLQLELMKLAIWLADEGSPALASDACVAQELIQASFFGGLEMVRGNLKNLDEKTRESFLKKLDETVVKFGKINKGIGSVAN